MQEYSGHICQPPEGYIVIVVSRFNTSITQRLLDGAIAKLRQHNVQEQDIRVVWVPGTYEIPFIANHFADEDDCLAVICLGAVIKGETSHDQHINRAVSMTLCDIALRSETPVIFGVLTCDNIEQANARSGIIESAKDKSINPAPGNKGAEAAEAALEMIDLINQLKNSEENSPSVGLFGFMRIMTNLDDNTNKYSSREKGKKDESFLNIHELNNYYNDIYDKDYKDYESGNDDIDIKDFPISPLIKHTKKTAKKTTKKAVKKQTKKKKK
ncbi:MAG: 6,7-dimethyl-8-ribityllumazine synthase [Planctomycetaceae bacterium]|jgi:6,7-dimethyl-8-ribityllumazine synthase|nr:6,7-dimethyl-8-ribityllumazine synthase [Planctomycetaceae bacterium]